MPEQLELPCAPRQLSPLTLAFMGDAVYELLVREHLMAKGSMPVGKLHRMAVAYVRASFQARVYDVFEPLLAQDEADVMRRGRNSSAVHPPKNADMAEYRKATGVETLFGYLHLCGRKERVLELFALILEQIAP